MGKTLPAQEISHCIIFPIMSMQILLWQKCISVFVMMWHFQMIADPTGPWAPDEHEMGGQIHTSWQSRSNTSNTEVCEELTGTAARHQYWKRPPSSHHCLTYMHIYVYLPVFIKTSKQTGVCSSITAVRRVTTAIVSFHESCGKI